MKEQVAGARRIQRGFTLIELMVTLVVVAILAAIAYPSYTSHVVKANRRAAQAQMMELASREQQFLLAQRSFVTYDTIAGTGYALPTELAALYTPTIAVDATTVPAYTITFTAKGRQLPDGNLTLNSEGVKGPAGKW